MASNQRSPDAPLGCEAVTNFRDPEAGPTLETWRTRRDVRTGGFLETQIHVTAFLTVGVMRQREEEGPHGFQHEGGRCLGRLEESRGDPQGVQILL